MKIAVSVSLLAAFAGCAQERADEDSRDDAFATDGKADSPISPDEAVAILQVVNAASLVTLEVDVQLSHAAASNIVTARATAPLSTLEELDAVPYVGPISMHRLLDYVHAQNLVAVSPAKTWHSQSFAGYGESLALSPSGEGVVLSSNPGGVLELRRGAGPAMPISLPLGSTPGELAVDASDTPHLFFGTSAIGSYEQHHISYQNGSWQNHSITDGYAMHAAQSPGGAMFGLAQRVVAGTMDELRLLSVAPNGAFSEVERWTRPTQSGDVHVAVDDADAPTVTYHEYQRGFHHARHDGTAWTDELVVESVESGQVASTGGDDPVVVVAVPFSTVRFMRRGANGWNQVGAFPVDDVSNVDAAVDGDGVTHACVVGARELAYVQLAPSGGWTKSYIGDADTCQIEAGPDGVVHLLYRVASVVNYMTYY